MKPILQRWQVLSIACCLYGIAVAHAVPGEGPRSSASPPAAPPARADRDTTGRGVVHDAAESLFVAVLRTGPAYRAGRPPTEQPGFAGHAGHMRRLSESGTILLGGPFGEDPARFRLSGAVLILRAPSLGEARRLVAEDPGVASGLMVVDVVQLWVPATGRLVRHLARAP